MKTADEIAALKSEWACDPYWNLEDAPGFEEHRAELLGFRRTKEAEWAAQRAPHPGGEARLMTYRMWLAGTVLASLAQTGGYSLPDTLAQRAVCLADCLIARLGLHKEQQRP